MPPKPKPKPSADVAKQRREADARRRDHLPTIRVLLTENALKDQQLKEKNLEVEQLQKTVAEHQAALRELTDKLAQPAAVEPPECPVCREPLVSTVEGKPKFTGKDFSCGHTVCERCIDLLRDEQLVRDQFAAYLRCPVCRKLHFSINATEYPTNYLLKRILQNE